MSDKDTSLPLLPKAHRVCRRPLFERRGGDGRRRARATQKQLELVDNSDAAPLQRQERGRCLRGRTVAEGADATSATLHLTHRLGLVHLTVLTEQVRRVHVNAGIAARGVAV
jgi:hypothetical protein